MKDNMKLMFAFVIAAFAVIACAFIISDAGDSSATGTAAQGSDSVASVTIDGTTTYYTTLDEAVTAAQATSGKTVTIALLKDVTTNDVLAFTKAGDYTLDIGTFTVTQGKSGYMVNAGGSSPPIYPFDTINTDVKLTIKGTGTFSSVYGSVFRSYGIMIFDGPTVNYKQTDSIFSIFKVEEGSYLTINSGTFNLSKDADNKVTRVMQTYGTTVINGGTFNGDIELWHWGTYVSTVTVNGGTFNGKFLMREDTAINPETKLTKNDKFVDFEAHIGNQYFRTLAEAVSEASANSTVTLLKNVELSSMLTISKKLTIDGGNFTLSASDSFADSRLINVPNANGDLTLKNITADANNKCRTVYCANGTLTVADGTKITGGKTANSYIGGVYMTGKSTFYMTGGEISGNNVSDTYKSDGYIQYSADLWIGSEAHGYISGGKAVNVFVNSNPSASPRAGLDQTGGEIGTVFVEWDGAKNVGEFVYTDGTVTSIVMAANSDDGNHIYETKTPVKGTTYKMSAEASLGDVSYAYLKGAVAAANSASSNVTINVLKSITVSENMTINNNVAVAVGDNIVLTVFGGKTLVVDGAVTLGTESVLKLEENAVLTGTVVGPSDNKLVANGLKAGSGGVTLTGGSLTINGTIVSKTTTVGEATITVSGDNIVISGSLDESANVIADGSTKVTLRDSFTNNGSIEVKGNAKITVNTVTNNGTIEVKGDATATLNSVTNNGTIKVEEEAAVTLAANVTSTGVIELKDTAKIESSSSVESAKIANTGLIVDERTISAETPVVPLDKTVSTGKVTAKDSSTVAEYVKEYTGIETTEYVTATIAPIADQVYTGSAIKPAIITFKDTNGAEVSLTEGTDYTVTYTGNTAVGTATVKVTPKGDTYGFTPVTASFTIYTDASTEGTIVTSGTSYTFTTGITTTGKLDIVLKEGTNEYTMTFAAGTVIPAGTVVSIEYVTSSMTASSINYEIKTTGYNGSFTVNVPCQEKFSKATVYCLTDPSVKVTDVKYNSKEGNVTFTADHNSTFVITLEKSSTVKVTDDGSSSSDSGDYGVMIAFLMLAAAIGFLAVIIKRS